MSAPATTATVTAAVTTTTPSNYYEFNHYSGKLHDWSMSCISFDNIAWAPVGLVTLVAATVARVFEGALMAIVNSILAVKNCICGAAEEVAPPVVTTPPAITTTATVTKKSKFTKGQKVAGTGLVAGGCVAGTVAYLGSAALGLAAGSVLAPALLVAGVTTGAAAIANKLVKEEPKPQAPGVKASVTVTQTSN